MCPNPCSNGIWSATDLIWEYGTVQKVLILVLMEYGLRQVVMGIHQVSNCLNPCFNGIWSATNMMYMMNHSGMEVLILVLMEYGLRLVVSMRPSDATTVLILVLMEYGLRHDVLGRYTCNHGLNPCFNGIWSATQRKLHW